MAQRLRSILQSFFGILHPIKPSLFREAHVLFKFRFPLILFFSFPILSQEDSVAIEQDLPEVRIDKNFDAKYHSTLALLRKTYPMALEAKRQIEAYEEDLKNISKKRKRKKYGKNAHAELKDDFVYNIKDLYLDEGKMLFRLVHRETCMTVSEIIERYKGKGLRIMYKGMAKIWGHSLDDTYDPTGEDYITELIIQDINDGHIHFDLSMNSMDKVSFKQSRKEYRTSRRSNKKVNRRAKRGKKN